MSFMYNPFPFDDPKPVNRPELSENVKQSIIAGGTPNVAKRFVATLAEKAGKEPDAALKHRIAKTLAGYEASHMENQREEAQA